MSTAKLRVSQLATNGLAKEQHVCASIEKVVA